MARLIGATGTVYYNGITFPPALHSKAQIRPVEQVGGVNRKYLNVTLNVDTVLTYTDPPLSAAVANHQDMGSNMNSYRQRLTEYRKTLVFDQQGFGNIIVNPAANNISNPFGTSTEMIDVAFGPKPRLLVWEPVGSNRAAHVSWVCEANLVDCVSGSADNNKLLEITYESSFNVNHEGLLTRTVRATIEIRATTSGSTFLDTVDNYTQRFSPPKINGFHRETHRLISRDHRTMQITYTDTEIASDNPFPAGMIDIRASQDLRSNLNQDGFTRWVSTLSGTLRWAKNIPRSWAWGAFATILTQRLHRADTKVYVSKDSAKTIKGRIIPLEINISEELFDREASFSVSWQTMVTLPDLFNTTKMFQPLAGLSWAQWHKSLADIQSPFGGSGLKEKVADLKVIDVCGNQVPGLPNNEIKPLNYNFSTVWTNFSCSQVTPASSWLNSGEPTIRVIQEGNAVPQKRAYGPDENVNKSPPPSKNASSVGTDISDTTKSGTPASYEDTYQNRTYNSYILEVKGRFERICYEPYVPTFESYGGVPLVLRTTDHTLKKMNGQFFPIYSLEYTQTYYLARLPEGNPQLILKHDAGKGDR